MQNSWSDNLIVNDSHQAPFTRYLLNPNLNPHTQAHTHIRTLTHTHTHIHTRAQARALKNI